MPDCECEHSNALHADDGHCSVPGCACDELRLPALMPDVPPPCPGACLHVFPSGEAVWVVEDLAEVEQKLNDSDEFTKFTACDFEEVDGQSKKQYCTFRFGVRPQAITSYHEFLPERWDKLLKNL